MRAVATKSASNDISKKSPVDAQKKQTTSPQNVSIIPGITLLIQQKSLCPCDGGCSRCTNERWIQPKLKIGQPNDKYEQEADRVADQVMRMPESKGSLVNGHSLLVQRQAGCTGPTCNEEEEPIQTKTIGDQITPLDYVQRQDETIPEEEEEEEEPVQAKSFNNKSPPAASAPGLKKHIQSLKGVGQPLPEATRAYFESRFGSDLSQVRIHTGEGVAYLSRQIHAQAFTVGNDIFFGTGKYDLHSTSGKTLIAHELVHTFQQNPRQRFVRPNFENRGPQYIQRQYTFAPPVRPKGTLVHSTVLPMLAKANADLFVEVKIPGAQKGVKDIEKAGIADFYKADPTGTNAKNMLPRTIGIRYTNSQFEFLEKDSKLQFNSKNYSHGWKAAPTGPKTGKMSCKSGTTAQICKLDVAPVKVFLGDLKPGGSSEVVLGVGQIRDYQGGIELTKTKVNEFIDNNPTEVLPQPTGPTTKPKKWDISAGTISENGLIIPEKLKYPTGAGIIYADLWVYDGGRKLLESSLKGGLYVYQDKNPGIWSYEWIPKPLPTSIGHKETDAVLTRLHEDVLPTLQTAPNGMANKKSLPVQAAGVDIKHTHPKRIQRKKGKTSGKVSFDLKKWKSKTGAYGKWKVKHAGPFLKKGGKAMAQAEVAATLVDIKKRTANSGTKINIPQPVMQTGQALKKIKHWMEHGLRYGRLRKTFGSVFVKVSNIYQDIIKRFEQDKFPEGGKKPSFASGPVGAAAKVAFGLVKQFLTITSKKVTEKLVATLKTGALALVKQVFSQQALEKFHENFAGLEQEIVKVKTITAEAKKKYDDKVETFLKEYEDQIKFANEIKKGLITIGDIISIVKWGVRIFQCATPPLLGCLKLVFFALSNKAIELVVKSCWFQKKVILPLFNSIKFFKEMPQKIGDSIIKLIRQVIPLPETQLNILFPGTQKLPASDIKEKQLKKCDPGRATKEQRKLAELFDKHGERKMELLVKMLEAKNIDEGVKLQMPHLKKIDEAMNEVSEEDLENASKDPDKFKGKGKDIFEDLVASLKFDASDERFEKNLDAITKTAPHMDKLARLVRDAEIKGLYSRMNGWHIIWSWKAVKKNKVWAIYYTNKNGENAAAAVRLELIDINPEKKWAVVRVLEYTHLVNAEGKFTEGSIGLTLLEGKYEGRENGQNGDVKTLEQ